MKTILFCILSCLLCSSNVSYTQPNEKTKTVILQAIDSKVSSELLMESSKIITERLKTYNLKASVNLLSEKGQIEVQLPENTDISEIEGLLTSKGTFGFYETLTLNEISEYLNSKNQLAKKESKLSPTDAKIGCSTFEDSKIVDTVKNYLKRISLYKNIKLLWSLKNKESETCVYALKTNDAGNPPLTGSDIELISSSIDKDSQSFNIELKFKPQSARIWSDITKKNINKPIAEVIDEKVVFTPVVKAQMENGLCEISGNRTQKEATYFIALVKNGPLPMAFKLK
jgi:preprotein translocase subunit SecD